MEARRGQVVKLLEGMSYFRSRYYLGLLDLISMEP